MAEYIEREALIQTIQKDQWIGAQGKDYALCDIAEQPTADVVEVIRCKDCFHSRPLCHTEKRLYNDDCVGCTKISTSYHSVIMNKNDFCSFGAKMDGKGDNDGQ